MSTSSGPTQENKSDTLVVSEEGSRHVKGTGRTRPVSPSLVQVLARSEASESIGRTKNIKESSDNLEATPRESFQF